MWFLHYFSLQELIQQQNLKTYEQAKHLFNPGNTQSLYGESLKEKRRRFVFPFQLVQYTNTEFML